MPVPHPCASYRSSTRRTLTEYLQRRSVLEHWRRQMSTSRCRAAGDLPPWTSAPARARRVGFSTAQPSQHLKCHSYASKNRSSGSCIHMRPHCFGVWCPVGPSLGKNTTTRYDTITFRAPDSLHSNWWLNVRLTLDPMMCTS